jgi:NADH dehydrogenase FAD-containing subunit
MSGTGPHPALPRERGRELAEDTFEFLILGGGFGGVEVAEQLRRRSQTATIAIVTPTTSMLFRPWLIYLPAQRITIEGAQIDLRPWAARNRITLIEGCAQAVDAEHRTVRLVSGSSLGYSVLAVATGAVSDRQRIPGADRLASWPCDLHDALAFTRAFKEMHAGVVTVIAAGERPGPGLEYAGWLARAMEPRPRSEVRVRLLDHEGVLRRHLGRRAMAVLRSLLPARGHELVEGIVEKVDENGLHLRGRIRLESALTAVVGPLSGCTQALSPDLLDSSGFVAVDGSYRSRTNPGIFAVGDVAGAPGDGPLPKSWIMARLEARTVAENMVATLKGTSPTPFNIGRARRFAISMPDVGGTAVVVRNGRMLMHGRWPLALRSRMDHRYIRSHSK